MSTEKIQYFMKLSPKRPTFISDMTDEESVIMNLHTEYWAPFVERGIIDVLSQVSDPKNGCGISIIAVENEHELKDIIAKDPVLEIGCYEYYPLRAGIKKR